MLHKAFRLCNFSENIVYLTTVAGRWSLDPRLYIRVSQILKNIVFKKELCQDFVHDGFCYNFVLIEILVIR